MANVLVVDTDGPRRSRLASALEAAGHRPLLAGGCDEAIRMASIYLPEVTLIAGWPADASPAAVVEGLAEADPRGRERGAVLAPPGTSPSAGVTVLPSLKPNDVAAAVAAALSRGATSEQTNDG